MVLLIVDQNNNFCKNKNGINSVHVKIPHLSKKIQVNYEQLDSVNDLIEHIQVFIKDTEYNFGILLKNQKKNIGKFVKDNVYLVDIINGDNKLSYEKKRRIFNFDIPNIKRMKSINNKDNQDLFLQFVLKNDLQSLLRFLQNGFDPNYLLNNEPVLHYAVVPDNSVALLTLLISQGAHIDFRSTKYQTVLHKAVKLSKAETVKIILEFGLHPNVIDCNGLSPLYFTVLYNTDVTCLERLLKHRASTNCVDNKGMTPFHQACYNNKLGHLKILLNQGGDINEVSKNNGNSMLHFAVLGKAMDCVSFLLEKGAKFDIRNKDNMTALAIAESSFTDSVHLFHLSDSAMTTNEIKEEKHDILETANENNNKDVLSDEIMYSCVLMSTNDGDADKIGTEPSQKDSTVSSLSLNAGSVFTDSTEIEEKIYFGLQTKIVKFQRSPEYGFGFSLESSITDNDDLKRFLPSLCVPSIHRICKWRVLSTMMTLFAKPYLLEVNQIYVGNMSHIYLIELIASVKDRVELKITNSVNYKSDTDNDVMDITSRVSSVCKLDDIHPFGVLKDGFKPLEQRPSYQGVENSTTLQLRSPEKHKLCHPQLADCYKKILENNNEVRKMYSQSTLPVLKSEMLSEKSLVIPQLVCNKILETNLSTDVQIVNLDTVPPIREWYSPKEMCKGNSNCRDTNPLIFDQISPPQYGLHRTSMVLPLNKSYDLITEIHIPLNIN